jgi:hypothetical protein
LSRQRQDAFQEGATLLRMTIPDVHGRLGHGRHGVDRNAPAHQAGVDGNTRFLAVDRIKLQDHLGQARDRTRPGAEVHAGMGGLALDLQGEEQAALALPDEVAVRPSGLGVQGHAGAAGGRDDPGPGAGRRDLLVRGEETGKGDKAGSVPRKGGEQEALEHQAALHVRHPGAVEAVTRFGERAPRCRAAGKHRVHVPHEEDGGMLDAAGHLGLHHRRRRGDGGAAGLHAMKLKEGSEALGHLLDAGRIEARAVDVHQLSQQLDHVRLGGRKPVEDGGVSSLEILHR